MRVQGTQARATRQEPPQRWRLTPAAAAGPRGRSSWLTRTAWPAVAVLLALGLAGCSLDNLLKSNELPPDVTDPALAQTPQGAMAAYNGTLAQFRATFGGQHSSGLGIDEGSAAFVPAAGLLSDELLWARNGGTPLDRRLMLEGSSGTEDSGADATYGLLHRVRALAGQTIGLLIRYVPDQPALVGHTYALEGYAEVFLAELFCSGIPLSTVDYSGDYTYQPGSTTDSVFTHAVVLFDSALALAGDNTRVVHLAALGKARALLTLGDYAGAAAAVAAVPDDYRYTVSFTAAAGADALNFAAINPGGFWAYTVGDREGGTGLDFRTSGDPRTAVTQRGSYTVGFATTYPIYHPNKYRDSILATSPSGTTVTFTGADPMVVASGVEARLIEAEAALRAGDATTWRAKLNALRTDGTQDGSGNYNPGSGGVGRLAPLTDPGTDAARVDLLFRERAFWLFLTGHRQGDLRRLVRSVDRGGYGRSQDQVYPTGTYPNTTLGELYGSDVTAPIPAAERTSNPKFTGCITRDA